MVRPRREKSEIIMMILNAALRGAKKTHIEHRANLSHLRLNQYLDDLLSRGLIALVRNPHRGFVYQTTDDGRALLKAAGAFYELLLKRSPCPA